MYDHTQHTIRMYVAFSRKSWMRVCVCSLFGLRKSYSGKQKTGSLCEQHSKETSERKTIDLSSTNKQMNKQQRILCTAYVPYTSAMFALPFYTIWDISKIILIPILCHTIRRNFDFFSFMFISFNLPWQRRNKGIRYRIKFYTFFSGG